MFPTHKPHQYGACVAAWLAFVVVSHCGCGTTREHQATEQLVVSDAVDRSIQDLDFRPLAGRKVYLDTSYLRHVKSAGFVNSEYVISGLRQQVLAAGCLLQDSAQEAEIIIEPRIGTLGADNHQVTYGIPENNAFRNAASLIPNAPAIPLIPEIALARRESREAAAKLAAFAYDRETRKPIWQSGVRQSMATARDTWVLGAGPFQGGTIREKTKLAGSRFKFGRRSSDSPASGAYDRPAVDYNAEMRFNQGWPDIGNAGLGPELMASGPQEADAEDAEAEEAEKASEADAKVAEKPSEKKSSSK
jgi:hypothetical protein